MVASSVTSRGSSRAGEDAAAEARCVDLAAQVNVWVKRGMKLVNIKEGDAGEQNENVVNAIGTPGWYASMGSGVEAATRMASASEGLL